MNIALNCIVKNVVSENMILEVTSWNATLNSISTTTDNITKLLPYSMCTIVVANVSGVSDILGVELGLAKTITIVLSENKDGLPDSKYNYHIACGDLTHHEDGPTLEPYIDVEDRRTFMSMHRI